MADIVQSDWFVWGIGLILALQILVVVLGELLYRADRRTLPVAPVLRALRNAVLPLAVAYLFVVNVLEIPEDQMTVRAIATAFWISILYAGLLLLNLLVFEQAPEGTWRHNAPSLFQDLIRLLLVAIGAAIVLSVIWQQNLGGLIAALGVGSIVLGLALQETLGNLMAGIALLFEKPFSVGDWIEVDGEQGEVVQINWRSVHVCTRERNLLVFPNSVLGRASIINYTRPTQLQILTLSLAFSLEDPPNKVKGVMLSVAESMEVVLDSPAPRPLVREVLDDRIRYEVFLFIDQPALIPQIVDDYTSKVWYAARRADITLPLPSAYEIKVETPPSLQQVVDTLDCLAGAQGFEILAEDDLAALNEAAEVVVFADGETVVAAGEVADAVYIIHSGSLHVSWAPEGAAASEMFLGPNEVIGVASLARRQASFTDIRCDGDVTLLRLPHELVDASMEKSAPLAHEFARLFEMRARTLRRGYRRQVERQAEETVLPVRMRRPQKEKEDADADAGA